MLAHSGGENSGVSRKKLSRRPGYMRTDLVEHTKASSDVEEVPVPHWDSCLSGVDSSRLLLHSHHTQHRDSAECGQASSQGQHTGQNGFQSNFSFIQLSLNTRQGMAPVSFGQSEYTPALAKQSFQDHSAVTETQLRPRCLPLISPPVCPEDFHNKQPLQDVSAHWTSGKELPDVLLHSHACSLDAEAASSSVDSSATSGHKRASPCSDPCWQTLVRKYEGVLRECLQSNQTNSKMQSMMLKLQRLQQQAVLEDDYDTAEGFGKKLEELQLEQSALTLGLPSRQPAVVCFLQRLRLRVQKALHRDSAQHRHREAQRSCAALEECPMQRTTRLHQEKQLVEAEMQELQRKLAVLRDRRRYLDQELQREEELQEGEEEEALALSSCNSVQLQDLNQALDDTLNCEHRARICYSLPPTLLRLQEHEQALNISIREATAKVVMSQRLGCSLRRKVSKSETQFLALHEAKLAAISGSDFSCAKELKAELCAVYAEQERLQALEKKLQTLSAKSSLELHRMKEQHGRVKEELQLQQTHMERTMKENTFKYTEVLEERLRSCRIPAVQRVWEADLETCHILLRGLQLRAPSCEGEDDEPKPQGEAPALGGSWCSGTHRQHSHFTKKLEELLCSLEDNEPEVLSTDAAGIAEQCDTIALKLVTLEEQLQAVLLNQDSYLHETLQQDVQGVKSTLKAMLERLKEEEDKDEESQVGVNTGQEEEEEEEEEQYFSDSWEL